MIKGRFRSAQLLLLSFPLQHNTARRPQVFNQLRAPPPPLPSPPLQPISPNGTNKNPSAKAPSQEEENQVSHPILPSYFITDNKQSSRPSTRRNHPTTKRHQPLPDFLPVRSPPTHHSTPLLQKPPQQPDAAAGRGGEICEDDADGEGVEGGGDGMEGGVEEEEEEEEGEAEMEEDSDE